MHFKDIIGQQNIKNHLIQSVENGRIPHAQLFVAPSGSGALALAVAYARYILCHPKTQKDESGCHACHVKFDKLVHPDLHFVFPVNKTDKVKDHPISDLFLEEWRKFVLKSPYGTLFNWYQTLGIENKQGQIGVDEAESIVKKLSLKSFEGGYKIMIIWMAEKMNTSASNKLLKLIEEPPKDTLFILIAEEEEQIINTIRSRCQLLQFRSLSDFDIQQALVQKEGVDEFLAAKIANRSNGNYNNAVHILHNDANDLTFENWFIFWVRTAFKAKGNAAVIQDLIGWSDEIAKTGRETQKRFLLYCLQFFRQALMENYKAGSLVFYEPTDKNFHIKKFAPFVHGGNIIGINEALNEAIYHIERNGNAKIILLDLSMQLTRLLHQKEAKV
ncbi:DNA polymerase III subunit [Namhaeicola litoreus]|uniref:ATP-binding protein n=1 Tax=Namhaeicola litoreus TaxID=1052145 RepID=A0ABW3Y1I0_9FLAO